MFLLLICVVVVDGNAGKSWAFGTDWFLFFFCFSLVWVLDISEDDIIIIFEEALGAVLVVKEDIGRLIYSSSSSSLTKRFILIRICGWFPFEFAKKKRKKHFYGKEKLFFSPFAFFADFLAVDQAENIDTGAGIFVLLAPFNAGKSSFIFIEAIPLVTTCAAFFGVVFWVVDDDEAVCCCCCSRQIPRGWPIFVFDTLLVAPVSAGKSSDEFIPLKSFAQAPRCCGTFCGVEDRSFKVGNSSTEGTATAIAGSCWVSSLEKNNTF